MHHPLLVYFLGLILAAAPRAVADEKTGKTAFSPAAPRLDDPLRPLDPKNPRTEAAEDQAHALVLYASARLLQRNHDLPGALRRYQRAFRYDPDAISIQRIILQLCFGLGRNDEAVRYALLADEKALNNPARLWRLGLHLSNKDQWSEALKFFEMASALEKKLKLKPTRMTTLLNFEMGRLYFLTKNFSKSSDAFARVIEALAHPKKFNLDADSSKKLLEHPTKSYLLFGESFLEVKRLDEARKAFEKANQISPNKSLLAYNLARLDARKGRKKDALKKLNAYLDKPPSKAVSGAYYFLGELLKDTKRQNELIPRLEMLSRKDQENASLRYFLAKQYHDSGQLNKAQSLYKKIIKSSDQPFLPAAYRGLAEIYRKKNKPKTLMELLDTVAEKTGSLRVLGKEVISLADDRKLINALTKIAYKKQNKNELSWGGALAAGLLSMQIEQHDKAEPFFEYVIKNQPDKIAEILQTWGLQLLLAEKHEKAAAIFQRGVNQPVGDEDLPQFNFYLATALEMNGKTDEALAAARQALALDKDNFRIALRVPWILFHAKRYDDAIRGYKDLIDQYESVYDKPTVREMLREAHMARSNLYVLQEEITQAEESLEQVLDEFPEDIGALNDLGYLWADEGIHLQRSFKMIQKATQADPDNVAFRDSLGWVLYRLGQYEKAVAELTRAAQDDQPDGTILDHLGDAQLASKNRKAAIQSWHRAVKAFERDGKQDKAKELKEKIASHKKKP